MFGRDGGVLRLTPTSVSCLESPKRNEMALPLGRGVGRSENLG
jgi:hypothetical protein